MPQTESQEIGWVSTSLVRKPLISHIESAQKYKMIIQAYQCLSQSTMDRSDRRFNFYRMGTDVTKHKEEALRKGAL